MANVETVNSLLNNRRAILVTAFVVCVGGLLALVLFFPNNEVVRRDSPELVTEGETSFVLQRAQPTKLLIPKLNLEAPFQAPLGLLSTGEIEVPSSYDSVGYYQYAPTPGERGPAIVLGHVDSVNGPAIFFSLGRLKKGDVIEIQRDDGTVAIFAVIKLDRHLQSGFPTAEVYGDLSYAGLRLITCSGNYDRGELRYTHNLIVYAELIATSTVDRTLD